MIQNIKSALNQNGGSKEASYMSYIFVCSIQVILHLELKKLTSIKQ